MAPIAKSLIRIVVIVHAVLAIQVIFLTLTSLWSKMNTESWSNMPNWRSQTEILSLAVPGFILDFK